MFLYLQSGLYSQSYHSSIQARVKAAFLFSTGSFLAGLGRDLNMAGCSRTVAIGVAWTRFEFLASLFLFQAVPLADLPGEFLETRGVAIDRSN